MEFLFSLYFIVPVGVIIYGAGLGAAWQLGGAHWDDPGPLFMGIFWPITLPAAVTANWINRLAKSKTNLPQAKVVK